MDFYSKDMVPQMVLYILNQFGEMDSIPNLGDVVQSLEVHNDKLFVLVNNSNSEDIS